ncbi:MFS transporter [Paucibacter soli]|uniref:MFS transporter n=1 Tax=Paucibacter soli TaxID=3133433 RepID=UPI003098DD59
MPFRRAATLGRPMQGFLYSEVLTVLALMVGGVATPWWVAQQGGAQALALNGTLTSVAAFLFMPLLSPLGDAWPKQRLMMAGLLLSALGAAGMAGMISAQAYSLGWVLAIGALAALAWGLMAPASLSIAAELVPAAQLPEALRLQRSAQSLGRVLGPAVGGLLVSASTGVAMWAQCGLLLAAALAVRAIPGHAAAPTSVPRAAWRDELRQGLKASWSVRTERGWTLVSFVGTTCLLPGFGLLVPLKLQSLGLSGGWLGAAEAGLSMGMLGGALGGSNWVAARLGRFHTRVGGTLLQGLGLCLAGATSQGLVLVLALFGVGFANSCGVLAGQTHRMLAIPAHFRARLNAVSMMQLQVSAALGPALVGWALLHAKVSSVYVAMGAIGALSALGFALVPGLREMLSLEHEQVRDWYARQHPELFHAHSPATS